MTAPTPQPVVLLVDDEPKVTAGVRLALRRQPFRVLTAQSAAEAFETLSATAVSVVVTDERMPGLTGTEMLAALRTSHPDVMRIVLSGEASVEATLRAINDADVFRFLTKPCDTDELAACIRQALAARSERAEARAAVTRERADTDRLNLFGRALERARSAMWMAAQPIISTETQETVAYEMLVRIRDRDVPHPGALFDLAEMLKDVIPLERQLRAKVAALLPSLEAGVDAFVNVHPGSLEDPALYDPNAPLTAFAPRVVLEITERAALGDGHGIREKVDRLRALGYRIAVDDLGAGYAGLNSLVALQPDVVKLDMALVRDVDQHPQRRLVVASVARLCREMGTLCLAEGIESMAERDALIELGITRLQGYYHGRPAEPFSGSRW